MKKILATILALVMVFALCACGGSSAPAVETEAAPAVETEAAPAAETEAAPAAETEAAPAAESEAAPAAETASEVLIMGTSADYAPFEFMYPDASGEMVYGGIDVFVAEYIAEATGKTLQIENMAFDYLLAALQKGDYDIVIAAMEETEERLNAADFSDPYYTDYPPMILVKAENAEKFASLADFEGMSVAAQTATTKLDIVNEQMPGANAVALQNVNDMVNQLVNDKIDAAVVDGGVALSFVASNPSLAVAAASDELGAAAPYCIAVQKGDPKGLLPGINDAIAKMRSEGKIEEFTAKADELSGVAVEVSADAPAE